MWLKTLSKKNEWKKERVVSKGQQTANREGKRKRSDKTSAWLWGRCWGGDLTRKRAPERGELFPCRPTSVSQSNAAENAARSRWDARMHLADNNKYKKKEKNIKTVSLCVVEGIKQFLEKVSKFSVLHFNSDVLRDNLSVRMCVCV